ncbi:DUF3047 domain-containing protein [Marinobacter sp.]
MILLLVSPLLMAEPVPEFSKIDSLEEGWEPLNFPDIESHTRYELMTLDGKQVVKAETADSASGMITMIRVDPAERPILRWRWKVSNVYEKGNARRKNGDDYPARIYVAFEFEPEKAGFFERMKRKAVEALFDAQLPGNALNYIWASRLEAGTMAVNPFSDKTMMVAVDSGSDQTGEWVTVERNVLEDYREAFGEEPPTIVGIGIMSDSDNTGESATAWYGDIQLLPAP